MITHIEAQYSLYKKKSESKSHINKWNNKTIEIGCFDIEKTCIHIGRARKRRRRRRLFIKWLDKNMLTLTFDLKIKRRSLIQLYSSYCALKQQQ